MSVVVVLVRTIPMQNVVAELTKWSAIGVFRKWRKKFRRWEDNLINGGDGQIRTDESLRRRFCKPLHSTTLLRHLIKMEKLHLK